MKKLSGYGGKIFLVTISFCLLAGSALAQQPAIRKNALYVQGASKGAVYALTFERLLGSGRQYHTSIQLGAGVYHHTVALPIGINFFRGTAPHYLAYSLLVTPYIEHYQTLFSGTNGSDKKATVMPGIGYRFQPAGKGFFAKMSAGPVLYLDPPSDDFWHMETRWYAGITLAAGIQF